MRNEEELIRHQEEASLAGEDNISKVTVKYSRCARELHAD